MLPGTILRLSVETALTTGTWSLGFHQTPLTADAISVTVIGCIRYLLLIFKDCRTISSHRSS